jgi:hypothetical protein
MVVLESLLELNPSDFVSSRLHRLEMFPPHQCFTPKLQGCKVCLALVGARKDKSRKFGPYGPDPGVSFKRFFCFSERWGLHADKLGVGSDCMWSLMIGPVRRSLFQLLYPLAHLLLHLQELAQYVGMHCQKCLCGVKGGGGGGSPLPEAPKPLGVLRVGPTI